MQPVSPGSEQWAVTTSVERGAESSEDEVDELLARGQLNFLVLSVTFIAEEQTVAIDANVEAIGNDPSTIGARAGGGVAVCMRYGL